MKRLFNILVISVIYLGFCGKSCVDDSERMAWQENQAELAKDSIRVEFEAGYLSEDARAGAEIMAIQKVKDLSDYMKICSDVSMDSLFREKARELIGETFSSEDDKLSFGPVRNTKDKTITLGEFLKKGFGKDIIRGMVHFDSVRVSQHLEKSGDGIYSGELSAYQTLVGFISDDDSISQAYGIKIDFHSTKQSKVIGADTLNVWVVRLGDMGKDE